jgi:hypothetical protein
MRKPEQSSEPSIEEILASIRSIIAEDGKGPENSQGRLRGEQQKPDRFMPRGDQISIPDRGGPLASTGGKAEPQGGATDSADEIFELTEDFMVAEPVPEERRTTASSDIPVQSYAVDPAATSAPALPDIPPTASDTVNRVQNQDDFDEENLDEVLSNLAAEVDRLAAGERARIAEGHQGDTQKGDVADSPIFDSGTDAAPPGLENTRTAEEKPAVGMPPSLDLPPSAHSASPATTVMPERAARPKTKPVWSARGMSRGGESAKTQEDEQRSEPAAKAPLVKQAQKSTTISGRDRWAEGVQMPVPETGPEMPLPLGADESTSMPSATNAKARLERESPETGPDRSVVGSFLTRVFGGVPPVAEDQDSDEEDAPRSKAEELAHHTISDFAEEKLNAPAVGNVLKADKAFMNEVAESLENALAEAEEKGAVRQGATASEEQGLDDQSDLPPAMERSAQETESADEHDHGVPFTGPESGDVSIVDALPREQPSAPAEIAEQAASMQAASTDEDMHAAETAPPLVETDLPVQEEAEYGEARILPASAPGETNITEDQEAAPAERPLLSPDGLPSSLEGGIKEMIKPLIIQWLNDNLPRIVEQAVREELAGRDVTPKVETKTIA